MMSLTLEARNLKPKPTVKKMTVNMALYREIGSEMTTKKMLAPAT